MRLEEQVAIIKLELGNLKEQMRVLIEIIQGLVQHQKEVEGSG